MKIGMSGWRLNGERFGVARYSQYLLTHLTKFLTEDDSLELFLSEPLDQAVTTQGTSITEHIITPKLTNILWENLLLPPHLKNIDVLFGPSYTLPLNYKGKSVVSIHSVNEVFRKNIPFKEKYYTKIYRASVKNANMVIANSQTIKDLLVEHYGVNENKVKVVWLGVDDAFIPLKDESHKEQVRVKYLGNNKPYILFVGTHSERRNIPMLMKAFSLLKKDKNIPHSLLLVGKNPNNIPLETLAEKLGIADSFEHIIGDFPNHKDIIPVYGAADLFVMPASSEGFSLTLPEAMACGVPVITSDKSSLGEIANGYCVTLSDLTAENIAQNMKDVLTNPVLRNKLINQGLIRAESLRWRETARNTLDVLRMVVEN